ncbi:MAG: hypothetical protein ACERLB_00005, partial [Gammaproteobacteria bacterium]
MKKLLRKLFPPKKNELQIVGESIQKIMSQVETRYFDDLFVSVGKHSEKDACIEIIIKNESNLFLCEINLVSNHLIEYIAPGFTSHPMWDRCQMVHKGKTGIKEISPEILIIESNHFSYTATGIFSSTTRNLASLSSHW